MRKRSKRPLKIRIRNKLKSIWRYLRTNILTKDMILWVIIAELIFWSPVIVAAMLTIMVDTWYCTVVSAILLFWAGPFTPAIPLQIGLALALKGIYNKIRRKKDERRTDIRTDNKRIGQ